MDPYFATDSLARSPWAPSGEPHAKALERRISGQKSFNHAACDQDISIAQYMLYRVRFVLSDDLAEAWGDFGGSMALTNLIALVTDMGITDLPGISITYDRRARHQVQKLAQKRARSADYFRILKTTQLDIKAGVLRDPEYNAGVIKKEKEADNARKDKARTGGKAAGKAPPRKQWPPGDWATC